MSWSTAPDLKAQVMRLWERGELLREGLNAATSRFPLRLTLKAPSPDDITRRFERSVLTQLYRSYPSTRKLAKRLGVSHTAIANKLREYGLSQKKGDE